MGTSKEILKYSLLNLLVILVSISLFAATHISYFVFIPFAFSVLLTALVSFAVAPGIILTYIAFDGMLKILSNYNGIIHIGPDLLIIVLALRWLIFASQTSAANKIERPPLYFLFIAHAIWVAIEILNPYGLGIIPGIAAYKVYGSFLTLYFFTYLALDKVSQLNSLIKIGLVIIVIQTVSSIIQFQLGEHFLLAISPYYAKPIGFEFVGSFFRPFGTTSVAGGPSTWCFLSMPLLLSYFLISKGTLRKMALFTLFLASLYVLFICQVRSALIRVPLGLAVTYLSIYWGHQRKVAAGILVGVLLFLGAQSFLLIKNSAFDIARQRFEALSNFNYIMSARGAHFRERLFQIVSTEPLGIGLSRTGAAGKAFKEEIALDPFYGSEWAFTDNLYLALVIELGVPGALIYLALAYSTFGLAFIRLVRTRGKINEARCLVGGCLGLAAASIAGHWGSEGSLYLPECAYYWIFIGAGIRFSHPKYLNKIDTKINLSAVIKEIVRRNENEPKALKADGGNIDSSGVIRA